MKIAVLVLAFFVVNAAAVDAFPSKLQNGILLAAVNLDIFVLFLLIARSLYTSLGEYHLKRDAKQDE